MQPNSPGLGQGRLEPPVRCCIADVAAPCCLQVIAAYNQALTALMEEGGWRGEAGGRGCTLLPALAGRVWASRRPCAPRRGSPAHRGALPCRCRPAAQRWAAPGCPCCAAGVQEELASKFVEPWGACKNRGVSEASNQVTFHDMAGLCFLFWELSCLKCTPLANSPRMARAPAPHTAGSAPCSGQLAPGLALPTLGALPAPPCQACGSCWALRLGVPACWRRCTSGCGCATCAHLAGTKSGRPACGAWAPRLPAAPAAWAWWASRAASRAARRAIWRCTRAWRGKSGARRGRRCDCVRCGHSLVEPQPGPFAKRNRKKNINKTGYFTEAAGHAYETPSCRGGEA